MKDVPAGVSILDEKLKTPNRMMDKFWSAIGQYYNLIHLLELLVRFTIRTNIILTLKIM